MKPEFYTTIKGIILEAANIYSVGMWTNKMIDSVDQIRRFPIVLIEFTELAYNTMLNNTQECTNPVINVHVLSDTIDLEAKSVFKASQNIFIAMQREGFKRIRERSNYRGDELVEWIITFDCPRFTDEDARIVKTVIPAPELELDNEYISQIPN